MYQNSIKMEDDFVSELGYLALAVRLKRVSDSMVHSARQMYKSMGLDIEPNWYLILKLLKKEEGLPITTIADRLRFAHPSVISMIRKMKERGYVETHIDARDSRKQLVSLTSKAKRKLPELEKLWQACERGIRTISSLDDQFLDKLEVIEAHYREQDFRQRTLKELEDAA